MTEKVTIQVNTETKDKIVQFYKSIQKENDGEYILFFGHNDNLTLTVYSSKKEDSFKVLFDGSNALSEAKRWDENAQVNESKKNKAPTKASWEILDTQIGSDEVGTGDFFGPICVCAAYIQKKDIKRLKALGIDDSKRLNDDQIRALGKILINEFEYSQVSLNNEKYNELVEQNMNMNEMKAKMHNRVLFNLKIKHPYVKNVLIDQFVKEDSYYQYVNGEKEVVYGVTFKTKGETYFPSVAVGSIIARFSFLQHMDALSKKYGMEIPFGASKKVTEFAKKFVEKHGWDELDKVVKKNFANYKELTKLL